ncbi:glycosyltransferase family 39 protein [Conexibacter woesei]|uniref:Membrane protein-like protein n=1 Tax=Conexibacter woesei (strain DSM 14684 / CCUG 47730 / CIP 108061 / JCM 11494 / NBRC 100937 / ID131577) TaxID=469383 RepID=D3EZS2_CONWI|nr:glycosyltransferase family 39 protein [Conexibacter woesei]ADB53910.1 membrane protein-like protein [Conexibacter woesei DSM 14684]
MTGRSTAATPWLALAAIVLLAAALRFPTLATQSVWFDEAATWELTRLPFGEMLSALPDRESNPPLYYVLEWLWTRAFGDGAWGLRSLSAVLGTLVVPVAYGIGHRIGGPRAGLATAALIAVNPLLVWFSQEARSYELVVLLSAWSLLLFLRSLDDDRPRVLAWWAAASALALCSHYFAAFVLAPQVAWLVWRHPRRRAVLAAVGGLAVVGLALLPMLLEQRGNPYDIAGASIVVRLLQVPKQFLLGYRGPLALASGLAGAALIAGALWLLARHARNAVRERAVLVGGIGAVGVVLPAAAAVLGADYLNARNVIPSLVPLAAVLGAGFAVTRPPRIGLALLTALCAISLGVVVVVAADQQYQRPDWKGLARALGSSGEPRVLVVTPANGEAALRFYRRDLRTLSDAGTRVRDVAVVSVATSSGPGDPPVLQQQYGAGFPPGLYDFGPPRATRTGAWTTLRFHQPAATLVQPLPISSIRFGERPPSVALLPATR